MKMEQTKCSETSTYKLQTPANYPKDSILHISICLCISRAWLAKYWLGRKYLVQI